MARELKFKRIKAERPRYAYNSLQSHNPQFEILEIIKSHSLGGIREIALLLTYGALFDFGNWQERCENKTKHAADAGGRASLNRNLISPTRL